jgi:hypothetical protein
MAAQIEHFYVNLTKARFYLSEIPGRIGVGDFLNRIDPFRKRK